MASKNNKSDENTTTTKTARTKREKKQLDHFYGPKGWKNTDEAQFASAVHVLIGQCAAKDVKVTVMRDAFLAAMTKAYNDGIISSGQGGTTQHETPPTDLEYGDVVTIKISPRKGGGFQSGRFMDYRGKNKVRIYIPKGADNKPTTAVGYFESVDRK